MEWAAQTLWSSLRPLTPWLVANWVEVVGTAFALAAVILTMREHIACFPVGLVEVSLYLVVFARARLYSDVLLRAIWFVMLCYGWHHWLHGGTDAQALRISRLSRQEVLAWVAASAVGTGCLGLFMSTYTNADLAYWDAATTVLSLLAQWLLNGKKLESWVFWILVDVLCIGIYFKKALYPTMGLYTVFLVLATAGLVQWRRSYRAQKAS